MRECFDPETWAAVERRDGYACQASAYGLGSLRPCSGPHVVHHRKLRAQGGPDDMDNLVLLCDGHHTEVHGFPIRAFDCGLIVRSWQ